MIKNIIFDLDGTLANTSLDIIASVNYALKKKKLKKKINFYSFKKNANYGSYYMFKKIIPNMNSNFYYDINDIFIKRYSKKICVKSTTKKNLIFFLKICQKKRIKFFISTNKKKNIARLLLKKLKILTFFSFVAGSDSFKFQKPDPRHLAKLCKKFNLKKKECLYIGDTEVDAYMANSFNMFFVLIKNGYTKKSHKNILFDVLTSDYKQLLKDLQKKGLISN